MFGILNTEMQVGTLYTSYSGAVALTLGAGDTEHTYRLNYANSSVKFNLNSYPDGGEVEIWNFTSTTVPLSVVDNNGTQQSDKMFVAGDGNCKACEIDKYGAVVVKRMDDRFYVSGNTTAVSTS